MRQRVAEHPTATWLRWQDDEYTWSEVLELSERAANGLLALGVQPGDRVALMMKNCPEFLWCHFGALLLGGLSVPVNISQRGGALEHILGDSGASVVVCDQELLPAVEACRAQLPDLRIVVRGPSGAYPSVEDLLSSPAGAPPVLLEHDPGSIGMMYTSGTTGPPKGVVATQYDTSPLQTILRSSGVQPGETVYTALPLFHGNALLVSALGSMALDAKFALAERFSASRYWSDLRRYEAVSFNTLGGMISILLKQPPSPLDRDHRVRVVLSAGCPVDLWEPFEERYGVRIVEWFGMVDSPGNLLNNVRRIGSMGVAVPPYEFRVVDSDDREVAPEVVGELVFRHPDGRLTHYHNQAAATEEAYRGGWFHSGDLARRDAEGFFYYEGRKKESIRRLGENISAWEVESVVDTHPDVAECAAHAVSSVLGEDEVKLTVVRRQGASLTEREIVEFCIGKMAHYAVPRYVEFIDELPRTETQRVRKLYLKERGVTGATWDRVAAGLVVPR